MTADSENRERFRERIWASLQHFQELRAICSAFPETLNENSDRPIVVGVSGGGDSVALLLLLWLWGRRPLIAANVDHGLQAASAQWAQGVAELSERLGVGYIGLKWANPASGPGLAKAARLARHRLLAEAAREAGAQIICLGHNRDDASEAVWMQAQGGSVGVARAFAPSPVWPEGRGVWLYRPLVQIGRQTLRDWLGYIGMAYIDDPANANPASLRSQARMALRGEVLDSVAPNPQPVVDEATFAALAHEGSVFEPFGAIALSRSALMRLPAEAQVRVLSGAFVCAGGGETLPDFERIEAIREALAETITLHRTLCGAQLLADGNRLILCRETADRRGRPPGPVSLHAGQTAVWDGRFEIRTAEPLTVYPSHGMGLMRHKAVSAGLRDRLKALAPAVRQGIFLAVAQTGQVCQMDFNLNGLDFGEKISVRSLPGERFRAALSLIGREPST